MQLMARAGTAWVGFRAGFGICAPTGISVPHRPVGQPPTPIASAMNAPTLLSIVLKRFPFTAVGIGRPIRVAWTLQQLHCARHEGSR